MSGEPGADPPIRASEVLVGEVASLPPGRALDLGCGDGRFAAALAALGWSVVAVDRSISAALATSGRRLDGSYSISTVVGDAVHWESQGAFDLVVSRFALPESPAGRSDLLAHAQRALAPGGRLLVAEWEASMEACWDFPAESLPSAGEVVSALDELLIVRAETVKVREIYSVIEHREGGPDAQVLIVCAHLLYVS